MSKLEQRLQELEEDKKKILNQLEKVKANKTFICLCGSRHRIKDCEAIQTHWYTSPSGCMGGDYWNEGELQIICPVTDKKNRLLYKSYYEVEWQLRNSYDYNLEMQFGRQYKHLFKKVTNDHGEDKRPWVNNYYIDKHHEKFGLKIKKNDKI